METINLLVDLTTTQRGLAWAVGEFVDDAEWDRREAEMVASVEEFRAWARRVQEKGFLTVLTPPEASMSCFAVYGLLDVVFNPMNFYRYADSGSLWWPTEAC